MSHYSKAQLETFRKDAFAILMDRKGAVTEQAQRVAAGIYEMASAALRALEKMESVQVTMKARVDEALRHATQHGTMISGCGVLQDLSGQLDVASSKHETACEALRWMIRMMPELDGAVS